jgi:hypothetical protein
LPDYVRREVEAVVRYWRKERYTMRNVSEMTTALIEYLSDHNWAHLPPQYPPAEIVWQNARQIQEWQDSFFEDEVLRYGDA